MGAPRASQGRAPRSTTNPRQPTSWRTTCSTRSRSSRSPPAPPASSTRCPRSRRPGIGKISRLPVSIRIVLESVLRNCDGKKVTEEHVRAARQLGAERRAHRRDSVRRRARRAAGLHRRAAAVRSRRDAQRRARHGQEPEGDRAAGAGRPRRRPLGDDRLLRHAGRARSQHEARIPAQRRALPVHEMGHAGVRHVQGRAAGHRHRPPGEPRIPGARRAPARTASTIPTRSSAPTATRR